MMIGESASLDSDMAVKNEGEEEWMTCGTCVLTIFGHGVIIERCRVPGDREYWMFSVRIWGLCCERGSAIAYLNPTAIISRASACPGLVVRTPFDGSRDFPASRVLSVSRSCSDRPAMVMVQLPFGIGYLNPSSVECKVSRVMPLVEVIAFVARQCFHNVTLKVLLATTPIRTAASVGKSRRSLPPIPQLASSVGKSSRNLPPIPQLASSYNVDTQHEQTGAAAFTSLSKFDFKEKTDSLRRLRDMLKSLTEGSKSIPNSEENNNSKKSEPLNLVDIIEKTQNMLGKLSSQGRKLNKCAQEDTAAFLTKAANDSVIQKAVALLDNILKFLDGDPLEEAAHTLLCATEQAFLWWLEAVDDVNEPLSASELVKQFEEGTLAATVSQSILKIAQTQRKVMGPAIEQLVEYLKSEEGETTVVSVVGDGFKHISSLPSVQESIVARDFLARIDGEVLAKEITSSVNTIDMSQLIGMGEKALNDDSERNRLLNQVKDQALSFFLSCLPTWTVPTIHGKNQGVLYSLGNLNMAGFKVSPDDIIVEYRGSPTLGGFINVRDINAKFNRITWSCRQLSFPNLKAEGIANAKVHDGNIEISLGLRQSSQKLNALLFVLSHRSVTMKSLVINVETKSRGMQWVMNKMTAIFESAIRVHVCDSLVKSIDKHAASLLRPLNNYCSSLHSDVLLQLANIQLKDLPMATEMEEFMANGGVNVEVQSAYEASGLKFLNSKMKSLSFVEEGPLGLIVDATKDAMELDHQLLVIINAHEGSHAAHILGTGIDDILGSEILSCNDITLNGHNMDAFHILKDMPRPLKFLLRCYEIPSYHQLNAIVANELSRTKNEQTQSYVVTFTEQSLGLRLEQRKSLNKQEELVTVKGHLKAVGTAAKASRKVKVGDILTHINGSPVEKRFKPVIDSLKAAGRPLELAFTVPAELDISLQHPPLDLEIAYTRGSLFVVAIHRKPPKCTAVLKKGDILYRAVGRDDVELPLRFDASSFPLTLYFHREGVHLPPVYIPSVHSLCLDLVEVDTRCVLRSIRPLLGPAAWTGKFYPGQVILSVGTFHVHSPSQWKTALSSKHNWPGTVRVLDVRLKIEELGLHCSNGLAATVPEAYR